MILNKYQQQATEATENNVLVIGSPGSGKTRVIVERVAYLIENSKTSPYELALFTFTRLAAKEMKTRIEERIGIQAQGITVGTFHSVGLSLIQRFGELIGLRPGKITVYSEFESSYLLKDIAKELGIYKKSWKPRKKDILKTFSDYYEKGIDPEKNDPTYGIFKTFGSRLRENNSLSYDSILTGLKLLLPNIYKYLQFKHIICDEAHDNSKTQWDILKIFQELLGTSLYVIADTDQAIYGWRNADVDYLIRHQSEFKTYHLKVNYRSTGHIVDAANNLIKNNFIRVEKTMEANREPGEKPERILHVTSKEVVELYQKVKGGPNTAILGRNHYLLGKTSQIMDDQGIPNTYVGKEGKLTNSEEFRRFHAFLKLSVNPFDNFAFLLIKDALELMTGEMGYAEIRLMAAKEGKSHFQVWHKSFTATPFEQAESHGHNSLNDVSDAIDNFFKSEQKDWKSETRDFVYQWILDNPTGSIAEYLDWLAVYDIQDEIKEKPKGVQIQTIHSAKGLEFDTVILAGMNEGILPSNRTDSIEDQESERRLCYVAVTRAKNKLIITSRPEMSEFHGKIINEPVSRFIKEMGL